MMLSNSLLATAGRPEKSFVTFDVMRLPLGILTGMGFIGAGAILRRDNMVLGVTTAATLWFVTVMGLCFGAGQIWLGLAGSMFAIVILWGLKRFELSLKQDRQATLVLDAIGDGPWDEDIRSSITAAGLKIITCSVAYDAKGNSREFTYSLQWRGRASETEVPDAVRALVNRYGIHKVSWTDQSQ
jgi:putative Mg2+ transporter-C (MgtC) family protein